MDGKVVVLDSKIFRIIALPVHAFEGRQELLTEVNESTGLPASKALHEADRRFLVGIGGMGKTETARKLVEKYDSFCENVVWIDPVESLIICYPVVSSPYRKLFHVTCM